MNFSDYKYLSIRKKLKWLSRKAILTGIALSITLPCLSLFYYFSGCLKPVYQSLDKTTIYIFITTFYASIAVRYLRLKIIEKSLKKERKELVVTAIKSVFLLSIFWTAVLSIFSSTLFILRKNLLVAALFEISVLFGLIFTFPKTYDIDDWLLFSDVPEFIKKNIF